MNTAIINISDRAFSAVGFTVVADMWVCCVCGLWSHRWHFSFCFYTFHIASMLAGCSVCQRVVYAVCENGMFDHLPSLTPDRHIYLWLFVRISAHRVNAWDDMMIFASASGPLTTTQHLWKKSWRDSEIERNGIQEKYGGIRTMVFR